MSQNTQQPTTMSNTPNKKSSSVKPSSNTKLDLDNLFTIEKGENGKPPKRDARAKDYELKKCIGK